MVRVLLEHITKKYGDPAQIDDLNMGIRYKEFLVPVGPTGCGESTALRMILERKDTTSGE